MCKKKVFRRCEGIFIGLLLVLLASQAAFAGFADDYQFNNPVNLGPNINSPYTEYGLTITPDGNTLYFSSDRPGGYGGYDIYVSHRLNGEWQPAVNLGTAVNNIYWQYHPAISPDGTKLYFASDEGRPSDRYTRIWVSEIIDNVPQKAILLPDRVNFSWANTNPRFVTSDGRWLYGSSWYGGMWDVWRVDLSTNDYSVMEFLPAPVISYARDFTMYVTTDYKYHLFFSDRGQVGMFKSYASEIINGVYQVPELLPSPFNNFSSFVNSLSLAEGETIAYFDAAPIPGYGYGGWDIYYAAQDGYGNQPPVANAGENVTIASEEVATTILQGYASDTDPGDVLECRWLEGDTVILDWAIADAGGQCMPLDLRLIPFNSGAHTLTLEVTDGQATTSDQMLLTVDNSAPEAVACGGGVYNLNTDIALCGSVSDFDGDWVDYQWTVDGEILCSGSIKTSVGGTPVALDICTVSSLGVGAYEVSLQVQDGINAPNYRTVIVEVVDTDAPTLAPSANLNMLWPPNHSMVDIVIQTNVTDNGGAPVTLSVEVASNEPQNGLGDGDTTRDWTEPLIDQMTGTISLQLRAERSGTGNGRIYTLVITATDQSNNRSTALVEVLVPHNKIKK